MFLLLNINALELVVGIFFGLWQENMWSAVNFLKDFRNISDPTKRHDTQLTLFDINRNFAYKSCSEELSSV